MPNRLASATSPYLLQHADNPVDWWEWSDDAFDEARRRDLPVLLSVGYAACHWCHVMAHESFEDPGVAAVMNELFVNVKVDREERPDVDSLYMDAVVALTGSGGWPMTVFLTPDGEQDRHVAAAGLCEGVVAPLPPVDRVVGVLEEVGARGACQPVRHPTTVCRGSSHRTVSLSRRGPW